VFRLSWQLHILAVVQQRRTRLLVRPARRGWGRSKLNFSEWDQPQEEAGEAAEAVEDGSMPPQAYTWLHSEAKLSA
jgi:hypothetical protein